MDMDIEHRDNLEKEQYIKYLELTLFFSDKWYILPEKEESVSKLIYMNTYEVVSLMY